jgi:hypothetical protein
LKTVEAIISKLERHYPPNIEAMLDKFASAEGLTEFVSLIREFLPQHESDIMSRVGSEAKILWFVSVFSKSYFPLEDLFDYSEGYENFTGFIPVDLYGISYDDYEDFANRYSPEWICMLALIAYPFYVNEGKDGAEDRVPIMDEARGLVGDVISRIPPEGFKRDYLHKILDKTEYEAMALFADWVCAETGCWQLDASYEEGFEGIEWSKENVAELMSQLPKRQEIEHKSTAFEAWLKEDLKAHFSQLVNAIISPVPKEQLALSLEEE